MNSTPEEFCRALVQAFGDAARKTTTGITLRIGEVGIHFTLTPLPSRQIGALHIADLHVEISVEAGDASAVQKLLARVDRATQRGGG